MKSPNKKLIASAALGFSLFVIACGGSSSGQNLVHKKCNVVTHDPFPPVNIVVQKPAECPLYVPAAGYNTDLGEVGYFAAGTLGDYQLTMYNAAGQGVAAQWYAETSVCAQFSSCTQDKLTVTGTYPA